MDDEFQFLLPGSAVDLQVQSGGWVSLSNSLPSRRGAGRLQQGQRRRILTRLCRELQSIVP
jgi:hypothetical protein